MKTPLEVEFIENVAYTYADYLILPCAHNELDARHITTQTYLTERIPLNIPIVGANMGHLGGRMAEKLAQLGGIGILTQDFRLDDILRRIRRVKEANPYFHMPIVLTADASATDALTLMTKRHFDCVVVVDSKFSPIGIATHKDLLKMPSWEQLKNVMKQDPLVVPDTITTEEASKIMIKKGIHHLPVINAEQKLVGCLTPLDIALRIHDYKPALDAKGKLLIGVALGMKAKESYKPIDLARKYIEAGVDVLVLDIANGYLATFVQYVTEMRKSLGEDVQIVAGNVADYDGAMRLFEAGCNTVKVGIGPGGACTTRRETGVGVPQATAVSDTLRAAEEYAKELAKIQKSSKRYILADGGIRTCDDLAIAILLGASTVMVGSLFAGTYESAFETENINGEMWKRWRGNASSSAATYRRKEIYGDKYITEELEHSEGEEGLVKVTGSVSHKIAQLVEGLKHYIARSNSQDIPSFQAQKNNTLRLRSSTPTSPFSQVSQLQFAHLYIKPQPSEVPSRQLVRMESALAPNLTLNIPYVALPSDFVQKKICTITAQLGGIGFLSRKKTTEDLSLLLQKVYKVKSHHPYYFFPSIQERNEEIGKTIDFLNENAFSCAIIVEDVKTKLTPIGIATRGDLLNRSRTDPLYEVVKTNIVTVPEWVDLHEASDMMLERDIHHLPVVNAVGELVGCITPRDITLRVFYNLKPNVDKNGRLRVGVALKVEGTNTSQVMEEATILDKSGADILLLDIDDGYARPYVDLIQTLRRKLSCPIVAAGVSTYEGAMALFQAGADVVKAGSRVLPIPQIEAIYECARAALACNKKIISEDYNDIVYPRDAHFSLILGANAIGLRNVLAPTYESSVKSLASAVEGMPKTSPVLAELRPRVVQKVINNIEYVMEDWEALRPSDIAPTKVETSVSNVIIRFINGLRSSCTYSNSANLDEYQHRARLGLQSFSGYWEGLPHAFLSAKDEKKAGNAGGYGI